MIHLYILQMLYGWAYSGIQFSVAREPCGPKLASYEMYVKYMTTLLLFSSNNRVVYKIWVAYQSRKTNICRFLRKIDSFSAPNLWAYCQNYYCPHTVGCNRLLLYIFRINLVTRCFNLHTYKFPILLRLHLPSINTTAIRTLPSTETMCIAFTWVHVSNFVPT